MVIAPSRPLCRILSDLPWQEIRCPAKAGVPLAAPGLLVSMLACSSLPSASARQCASMYPAFCDVQKGGATAELRACGVGNWIERRYPTERRCGIAGLTKQGSTIQTRSMQSNTVSSRQDIFAQRGPALSISTDRGVGIYAYAVKSGFSAFARSSCRGAAHTLISWVSILALELYMRLQNDQERWRDHLALLSMVFLEYPTSC